MKKIRLQDVANYAAVIVAAVALYIGWDQARIGRNQQHADVFPVVQLRSQFTVTTLPNGKKAKHVSLQAFNAGVGPAFIYSGEWQLQGREITSVEDVLAFFDESTVLDYYYSPYQNFLLAAQEETSILQLFLDDSEQAAEGIEQFLSAFYAMQLSMCYCSLYQRCWQAQANATSPLPNRVAQCPIP